MLYLTLQTEKELSSLIWKGKKTFLLEVWIRSKNLEQFIRFRIKIRQTFARFPICLRWSWSSSLWLLQPVQKLGWLFLHLRSHTSSAWAQSGGQWVQRKPFTPRRKRRRRGRRRIQPKAQEGRLAVQIIHFPDTDIGTNKLGSASRVVRWQRGGCYWMCTLVYVFRGDVGWSQPEKKLTINQRSEPACCPTRADKRADDYRGATRTEQTRQLDSVKTLGLINHIIRHFDVKKNETKPIWETDVQSTHILWFKNFFAAPFIALREKHLAGEM